MNKSERMQLAQWSAGRARKAGAADAAITVANQRDIDVEHRDGKLDKLQESTQNYLALKLYVNGRYSAHTTCDLRKETLGKFIEDAVTMTGHLTEDPFRALPNPKYYAGRREVDLQINDPFYADVTSERRVAIAREIDELTRSQSDKIVSATSYYSDSHAELAKVHTNGFEGETESTTFEAGVEVAASDGDKGRPQDYEWRSFRFFKDLATSQVLARAAVDRVLGRLGQTKIATGVYDMVVENRAVSKLLNALTEPMGGYYLQQKSSFLDGKLGEKVASERLTLIDDPFIPAGLNSKTFDFEGMATRRRVMIDKGILKAFYIGDYYGKKLGMEPTTSSSTNTVFEYGARSPEEMLGDIKKGILVTGFLGGNYNSTTGDFSFGVFGKLVEDGRIVKAINEMNVSGNLAELFNQLVEVGNDPYVYSALRRPSMRFEGISFSGI
ncbi:MAG: TldD/PmbA family protein [candidate division Zixibacteria bacterium]|nr:TldD/PmbA family protein [candidate division Zixibacteria bacterium]